MSIHPFTRVAVRGTGGGSIYNRSDRSIDRSRRRGGLGEVDRVVHVGSVGPLGEENGARQGTDHDGDDPPEDGLPEHRGVDAAGPLEKSHARGSADLWQIASHITLHSRGKRGCVWFSFVSFQ